MALHTTNFVDVSAAGPRQPEKVARAVESRPGRATTDAEWAKARVGGGNSWTRCEDGVNPPEPERPKADNVILISRSQP